MVQDLKKLLELAYGTKETQPQISEQIMNSLVREMEHDDEHMHEQHPEGTGKKPNLPNNGSQEPPTTELNPNPDSEGTGEGATSTTGTSKEGTSHKPSDLETEPGENQMKEMGGMPPVGLAPGLQSAMMNGMQQPKPQMPQGMPTQPQMQQMQYTVAVMNKPIIADLNAKTQEISRLKAANVALNTKIKEMNPSPGDKPFGPKSISLDMNRGSLSGLINPPKTTETIQTNTGPMEVPVKQFPRLKTQEIKQKVSEINDMIKDGRIPKESTMYS